MNKLCFLPRIGRNWNYRNFWIVCWLSKLGLRTSEDSLIFNHDKCLPHHRAPDVCNCDSISLQPHGLFIIDHDHQYQEDEPSSGSSSSERELLGSTTTSCLVGGCQWLGTLDYGASGPPWAEPSAWQKWNIFKQ